MGADAAKVLGQKFKTLGMFRHDAERPSSARRTMTLEARWPLAWAGLRDRQPGRTTSRPSPRADWNYDRAAHLLAHAGFGGTPAEIQKLADAGLERAVALARALREHPESEDAAVRRIGAVGSDAERRFPRAGPKRPIARIKHGVSMGVESKPAGNRPVQPVSDRFFYWLRATMLETRRLGLLVGEPDAADHASGGREDGPAVARPLRHAREQGPRLPQDDAADRPVRAGRDGQHPRSGHPGRPEPGDAVLPRRAVQRQGRRRTRTSPAR